MNATDFDHEIDTLPGGSDGDDWEEETTPCNVTLPSCRKPHADDVTARPGYLAPVGVAA